MRPFSPEADVSFDPSQQYDIFGDAQSAEGDQTLAARTPSSVAGGRTSAQPSADELGFLPLDEWDEYNTYEEETPSRLRYSIEWKVAVNNRVMTRDTEQDVVLAPAVYWEMYLRAKVDKLVGRKLPRSSQVTLDDTSVVASVNDRSERDLTRRFDGMEIDWSAVARQFVRWSDPFRSGKKLRVDLTFNYVDAGPASTAAASRANKRGSGATQRMLADRASQLDAEEQSGGRPSAWVDVYTLMRCPGPPCSRGPYCWRDPIGKRHYKLRTHHLRALVRLVEQGRRLETHDDVPDDVREQLYAEEDLRAERPPASGRGAPTPGVLPITINNVMPSPASEPPSTASGDSTPTPTKWLSRKDQLDIPGPRDVAVTVYSEWQQSKVIDQTLQLEYQKACDATLRDGLDLEQVFEDQDADFFIRSGVKRGVARRFVRDIKSWAEQYKLEHARERGD